MRSNIIDGEINFTHILKKSAIQEMLCTFANIAGVSLCLCDKDGKILHGFIQETDDLYKVLVISYGDVNCLRNYCCFHPFFSAAFTHLRTVFLF